MEQKYVEKMYVGSTPDNLVQETIRIRNERRQKVRAERLKKLNSIKFKYYCSVCLIIRDENEYLEEWLRWHIGQGVQHFYIYDHGSKKPVRAFVKELGAEIFDKVTVIEWYGSHKDAQPEAYNDCLKRFGEESRWIGFLDADEQARVKTGQTLPEFLKEYEDYAGLFAVWLIYNANGQIYQAEGTLRERFTSVCHNGNFSNQLGKVFVQPALMVDMVIHNGRAAEGFAVVDERKNKLFNYSLTSAGATADFICVDHYYTKSYEEWLKKIKRGSGHAKYQRKYKEFFEYNADMEYYREDLDLCQKYEEF